MNKQYTSVPKMVADIHPDLLPEMLELSYRKERILREAVEEAMGMSVSLLGKLPTSHQLKRLLGDIYLRLEDSIELLEGSEAADES